MKIGCDIGNVIRDNATEQPIPNSIESLHQLKKIHQIFFISKAKNHYRLKAKNFLKEAQLDDIPLYFVYEDDQKIEVDKKLHLDVMIDDKMTILKDFKDSVIKIWFQRDQQKIDGCRKYQKEIYERMTLATSWQQVLDILKVQLIYSKTLKKTKKY